VEKIRFFSSDTAVTLEQTIENGKKRGNNVFSNEKKIKKKDDARTAAAAATSQKMQKDVNTTQSSSKRTSPASSNDERDIKCSRNSNEENEWENLPPNTLPAHLPSQFLQIETENEIRNLETPSQQQCDENNVTMDESETEVELLKRQLQEDIKETAINIWTNGKVRLYCKLSLSTGRIHYTKANLNGSKITGTIFLRTLARASIRSILMQTLQLYSRGC
jgi:hypothetical protein